MQGLRQDARYAVRTLVKTPAFTAIAVLTLALGIGANTAIFTVVHALLLKPLPFKSPEELMLVDCDAGSRWSYPKYELFRGQQRVFDEHAVFKGHQWSLTGTGEAERLRGELIGARYLSTLGVTPHLGRDLAPREEGTSGLGGVVLLGYQLWHRRFGGDPEVLGRTIALDAIPHTIVGVSPPGFRGLTGQAECGCP